MSMPLEQSCAIDVFGFFRRNRIDAYLGSRENLDRHMIEFSNAITDEVGVDFEAEFQIPIATALVRVFS